jgi:amidase
VRGDVEPGDLLAGLGDGVEGRTFAVVEEALAPIGCSPDVLAALDRACAALTDAGATIRRVSIPLWSSAWPIESAFLTFAIRAMLDSGGAGYGHLGRIDVAATATLAAQLRTSADDLAVVEKLMLVTAEHLRDAYLGTHYGKAQNLRLELRRQVERALAGVDVLLTPTTPTVAWELLDSRVGMVELVDRITGDSVLNTCALDLTGHPALTVPAGTGEHGLPVGLQLIGPRLAEARLYQAGVVVEAALGGARPRASTSRSEP